MVNMLCVGDKLRCINFDGWVDDETNEDVIGPEGDAIVTVRCAGVEITQEGNYLPVVWLLEYEGDRPQDAFWLDSFKAVNED